VRQGINEGWKNQLGVQRLWRNRGMATSWLYLCMIALKFRYLDDAALGVDAENLIGALQLNERLEFEQFRG